MDMDAPQPILAPPGRMFKNLMWKRRKNGPAEDDGRWRLEAGGEANGNLEP
jgi:hypothetical protein